MKSSAGLVQWVSALALLSLASVLVIPACMPDPKADYQEYVDRTTNLRGPPDVGAPPDLGPIDTGPPPEAGTNFSGSYLAACTPALLGGDVAKALLFYVDVKHESDKLDVTFLPMNEKATKMTKGETCSTPFSAKGAALGSDLKFVLDVGAAKIPGVCQRIGDSELVLAGVKFIGQFTSAERACAELDGQLTSPIPGDLSPPGDFCVFKKVKDGDPLPTAKDSTETEFVGFPASEFHCP